MNDHISSQLTSCDLEPIHIPGSIQPYGVMLIVGNDGRIVGYAGDAGDVLDQSLESVFGHTADAVRAMLPANGVRVVGGGKLHGVPRDAIAYLSGDHLVIELTEKMDDVELDAEFLAKLEELGTTLERTTSLGDLSRQAALIFQDLTGYGRVMIYQFTDDDAGVVLGEAISDASSSFMNHHFPASDIPRQARALYVRNKVRVIADVHYTPSPVVSASSALSSIDMSDSMLRSVSPIHIQYLKNMGVAASASMSIVKDGVLWGLVACHHHEPRNLSLTTRLACQAVAATLARQIKAREDSELYRERIRLRAQEDAVVSRLGEDNSLAQFFASSGATIAALLQADGFAAVQENELFCSGICPAPGEVRAVAEHVRRLAAIKPVVTSSLMTLMPEAAAFSDVASGLLAVTMSTEVPTILLWFRAQQLQTVKWAGNPHKDVVHKPGEVLSPRASFEAWSESVHGKSRNWSLAETESASRMVRLMLEAKNNRRLRSLNQELSTTLRENDVLFQQKDFLLKEVNHRVQNSLSLVSSFLRMQARDATPEVKAHLEQAEYRLTAVGLVHRRLYQDDSVEIVDLSRYLNELVSELQSSIDQRWKQHVLLDLTPILISTDRAVSLGLILNELIINITKYAYGDGAGPVQVALEQHRNTLRLVVADHGRGQSGKVEGTGFGSRMLAALMQRLNGTIEYSDNRPGLRVIVTAPVETSE
ncbi:MAG TPA: histidine kinase dimerization/phosphoacceptor domain -containing protein [Devosia sp.]